MKFLFLKTVLPLFIIFAVSLSTTKLTFAGDPAVGKMIWDEQPCKTCHGIEGTPIFPGVPNFIRGERMDKADGILLISIMNVTPFMPPFKGIISNSDGLDLIAFIRSLQQ
jgi:mono/diheme cytochrome c family protein